LSLTTKGSAIPFILTVNFRHSSLPIQAAFTSVTGERMFVVCSCQIRMNAYASEHSSERRKNHVKFASPSEFDPYLSKFLKM
jgi:hypothetical protein